MFFYGSSDEADITPVKNMDAVLIKSRKNFTSNTEMNEHYKQLNNVKKISLKFFDNEAPSSACLADVSISVT